MPDRAVKREFPRHRKFVRGFACSVPLCETSDPIEFAHVRSAANAGTGLKPPDWYGVSLCHVHHEESHRVGIKSFERKYRIDLAAMAKEFARQSPDSVMREAMNVDAEHCC